MLAPTKKHRAKYQLNGEFWTTRELYNGLFIIRRNGVSMGNNYPNRKSAEQTMFAMMRDELASLQRKAFDDLRHAIRLQEQIGTDWAQGLSKIKVSGGSE